MQSKMKALNTLFLVLILAFFTSFSFGPGNEPPVEKINWLSFEEAVKLAEKNPKDLFIDVYTNWCGWCKVMDKNTFSKPEIIKYVNKNFYPVKFNAESRDTVRFQGSKFVFVNAGRRGYHQLAAALLNNRLAYPTVVFLVDNFSTAFQHAGYQKPENLNVLLRYYAGNHYKKTNLAGFIKSQTKSAN